MTTVPFSPEPTRDAVDQQTGAVLLEFGVDWCPHCQAAQPLIAAALQAHPQVQHWRLEDGKGKRLGRSFSVKQWPTLIFLQDGQVVANVVRPTAPADLDIGFAAFKTA